MNWPASGSSSARRSSGTSSGGATWVRRKQNQTTFPWRNIFFAYLILISENLHFHRFLCAKSRASRKATGRAWFRSWKTWGPKFQDSATWGNERRLVLCLTRGRLCPGSFWRISACFHANGRQVKATIYLSIHLSIWRSRLDHPKHFSLLQAKTKLSTLVQFIKGNEESQTSSTEAIDADWLFGDLNQDNAKLGLCT